MPFPWSGPTGSPVAERVSRRGHVLDGGLALDWWSEDGRPTSLELGHAIPIYLRFDLPCWSAPSLGEVPTLYEYDFWAP